MNILASELHDYMGAYQLGVFFFFSKKVNGGTIYRQGYWGSDVKELFLGLQYVTTVNLKTHGDRMFQVYLDADIEDLCHQLLSIPCNKTPTHQLVSLSNLRKKNSN